MAATVDALVLGRVRFWRQPDGLLRLDLLGPSDRQWHRSKVFAPGSPVDLLYKHCLELAHGNSKDGNT